MGKFNLSSDLQKRFPCDIDEMFEHYEEKVKKEESNIWRSIKNFFILNKKNPIERDSVMGFPLGEGDGTNELLTTKDLISLKENPNKKIAVGNMIVSMDDCLGGFRADGTMFSFDEIKKMKTFLPGTTLFFDKIENKDHEVFEYSDVRKYVNSESKIKENKKYDPDVIAYLIAIYIVQLLSTGVNPLHRQHQEQEKEEFPMLKKVECELPHKINMEGLTYLNNVEIKCLKTHDGYTGAIYKNGEPIIVLDQEFPNFEQAEEKIKEEYQNLTTILYDNEKLRNYVKQNISNYKKIPDSLLEKFAKNNPDIMEEIRAKNEGNVEQLIKNVKIDKERIDKWLEENQKKGFDIQKIAKQKAFAVDLKDIYTKEAILSFIKSPEENFKHKNILYSMKNCIGGIGYDNKPISKNNLAANYNNCSHFLFSEINFNGETIAFSDVKEYVKRMIKENIENKTNMPSSIDSMMKKEAESDKYQYEENISLSKTTQQKNTIKAHAESISNPIQMENNQPQNIQPEPIKNDNQEQSKQQIVPQKVVQEAVSRPLPAKSADLSYNTCKIGDYEYSCAIYNNEQPAIYIEGSKNEIDNCLQCFNSDFEISNKYLDFLSVNNQYVTVSNFSNTNFSCDVNVYEKVENNDNVTIKHKNSQKIDKTEFLQQFETVINTNDKIVTDKFSYSFQPWKNGGEVCIIMKDDKPAVYIAGKNNEIKECLNNFLSNPEKADSNLKTLIQKNNCVVINENDSNSYKLTFYKIENENVFNKINDDSTVFSVDKQDFWQQFEENLKVSEVSSAKISTEIENTEQIQTKDENTKQTPTENENTKQIQSGDENTKQSQNNSSKTENTQKNIELQYEISKNEDDSPVCTIIKNDKPVVYIYGDNDQIKECLDHFLSDPKEIDGNLKALASKNCYAEIYEKDSDFYQLEVYKKDQKKNEKITDNSIIYDLDKADKKEFLYKFWSSLDALELSESYLPKNPPNPNTGSNTGPNTGPKM